MTKPYRPALAWSAVVLMAAAYLVLYSLNELMSPSVAKSVYTTNYQYLLTADSGTSWYNYDHRSNSNNPPYSTNVDWPIRYIFKGNATINAVKSGLDGKASGSCDGRAYTPPAISPELCANGDSFYHKSTMSGWSNFDSDGGIKRGLGSCQMDYHMRIYARGTVGGTFYDYNYNLAYGKHVFASVHRDWEGCSPANYFDSLDTGVSDSSESWFNNRINNNLTAYPYNWQICAHCYDWLNYEPDHYPADYENVWYEHHVQSNGYTNYVTLP